MTEIGVVYLGAGLMLTRLAPAPAWGFAVTGLVGASLLAVTIAYQHVAGPKPAEKSTDQADAPATA